MARFCNFFEMRNTGENASPFDVYHMMRKLKLSPEPEKRRSLSHKMEAPSAVPHLNHCSTRLSRASTRGATHVVGLRYRVSQGVRLDGFDGRIQNRCSLDSIG